MSRKSPVFIHDRFEVVSKLGHGRSSMVWLCYETAAKKWRALKIYKASMTHNPKTQNEHGEFLLQSVLEKNGIGADTALENHVLLPLETFWIQSVNGRHLCAVHHVLGPRLSDWMQWPEINRPDRNKHVITQLVNGMGFLHHNGICHGDFLPQNVLMQLRDGALDHIGVEEMRHDILGPPATEDIRLWNGDQSPYSPAKAYARLDWGTMARLVSDKIAIVGLAGAYLPSSPPERLGAPVRYSAPEVLLLEDGAATGIETDIYMLGRTLVAFRTRMREEFWHDRLRHDSDSSRRRTVWEMIHGMEMYGGPCPPPFRELALKVKHGDKQSEPLQPFRMLAVEKLKRDGNGSEPPSDGYLTFMTIQKTTDSEKHPEEYVTTYRLRQHLSPTEAASFGDLLHKLLSWQPQDRWTTDRILAHRWFSEELIDGEESATPAPGPQSWSYLTLTTGVLYMLGVILMAVYFAANRLASQPGFFASREDTNGPASLTPPSTVGPYVSVTFPIQELGS
ncbi:hypothetical protein PG985_015073 [Apiospora marii]|uniref:uncharacterized protein n=1 Tax=Apiospora marii TaxID=335849 RepID=UPI00312FF213